MKPPRSRRGVTLLEMVIYCMLLSMVAVFTMRAVSEARVLRSQARDRNVMAAIAQGEVERVRAVPASRLAEGTETRTDPGWPGGVRALVTLEKRADGAWLIDVQVERESAEGRTPVRLATIRKGGPS